MLCVCLTTLSATRTTGSLFDLTNIVGHFPRLFHCRVAHVNTVPTASVERNWSDKIMAMYTAICGSSITGRKRSWPKAGCHCTEYGRAGRGTTAYGRAGRGTTAYGRAGRGTTAYGRQGGPWNNCIWQGGLWNNCEKPVSRSAASKSTARHAARSTQQDATFGEPEVVTKLKAVAPAALSLGKTPGKPHDLVKR
jgi:hypothetical protein